MTLFIDADGCPVVRLAAEMAAGRKIPCHILCDTAHSFSIPGVQVTVCDKGADSVDFALVRLLSAGDVVVTQDYGLAAMCLAKQAIPIHQDGLIYTEENIDALLLARHTAAKVRRSGGRLKGPTKRTGKQDAAFVNALTRLLDRK